MSCLNSFVKKVLAPICYDTMPPEVIEVTKLCIADAFGIFQAGREMSVADKIRKALGREGVLDNIGDLACWMGGSMRLLDLDDGHRFAMGHPGVPIVAAAVAEVSNSKEKTSGKLFIEAVVKAYETYCYLGRAINPSAYLRRGFDATGVCGAAGAAVVVGVMQGLDDEQLTNAIAIACTLSGGLNQYVEDGSSPKYLCAGWAAKLGISAARFAYDGLTGPKEILEGRLGYCHGFSPSPDMKHTCNPRLEWEITHVYFKRYSCVRRIHTALDCIESFISKGKLVINDIERIDVIGGRFIASAGVYSPDTEVKAQTSVPYTIALLLRYGEVTLKRIKEDLDDEKTDKISHRVKVIEAEEFNQLMEREPSLWGAVRVVVHTKDGRQLSEESLIANGDPEKPFSKETLHHKFIGLSSAFLGKERAEKFWLEVDALETQKDVFQIFIDTI
jgi:2-methylcitrate dehydratase PrpD